MTVHRRTVVLDGKRYAYTAVVRTDGFGLGIAVEGEPGYYPLRAYPPGSLATWKVAGELASRLNREELGLDRGQAWLIVASTMHPRGGG